MGKTLGQKIASAKTYEGGNYFTDGRYTLLVKRMITQTGQKGDSFVAEFEVLESSPVQVPENLRRTEEAGKDIQPLRVGETGNYVVNLTKNPTMGEGNVKACVGAAIGANGTPEAESTIAKIIDAMDRETGSNPLKGVIVKAQTYRKITQKGQPFMCFTWHHVDQKESEIKERAKKIA